MDFGDEDPKSKVNNSNQLATDEVLAEKLDSEPEDGNRQLRTRNIKLTEGGKTPRKSQTPRGRGRPPKVVNAAIANQSDKSNDEMDSMELTEDGIYVKINVAKDEDQFNESESEIESDESDHDANMRSAVDKRSQGTTQNKNDNAAPGRNGKINFSHNDTRR